MTKEAALSHSNNSLLTGLAWTSTNRSIFMQASAHVLYPHACSASQHSVRNAHNTTQRNARARARARSLTPTRTHTHKHDAPHTNTLTPSDTDTHTHTHTHTHKYNAQHRTRLHLRRHTPTNTTHTLKYQPQPCSRQVQCNHFGVCSYVSGVSGTGFAGVCVCVCRCVGRCSLKGRYLNKCCYTALSNP